MILFMSGNIEIACPECQATIVIDPVSGQILLHKAKEITATHSIDSLMNEMASKKSEAAKRFEKELESQKDRKRILEEKFKEAMRRADKSEKPMPNPLDLE
jgi:hypothetical protein